MQLFGSLGSLLGFVTRHARGVRHVRLLAALVIVAGIVNGLANTVLIGVVNHVINAGGSPSATYVWLFVGICVVLPFARFGGDYLLVYLMERAALHLRMVMSRRILAAPLRKLEEVGSAGLLATLSTDIPTVTGMVAVLPLLCMNLTVVVGLLVYMGILSWKLLIGVVFFLVLAVFMYQYPLLRAQRHVGAMREKTDELFQHFRAVTEAVKELKLHHERRRTFLDERLERTAGEMAANSLAAQRLFAGAVSWGQVLVFVLVGLIAFAAPVYMPASREVLTGYVLAILFMVTPIQVVMNSVPQLSRAMASMRKVESLGLALDSATPAVPQRAGTAQAGWRSLELAGITHSYRSERDQSSFTLGPVNLRFEPGQIVFLTGGNGSGKTTLAKLLTGLYTPESGEVLLDGEPVGPAELPRLYALFSTVFSDFFLFDSLLGLEEQELDGQAARYLEELHLEHKVKVEGGRLSTTDLSQGQRKRLALLTAYLEDRPIYLFDEWAADQDPQFKQIFYNELLPQLRARGKTVFAITHDDQYYGVADRFIKLDYGQVVFDSGTDVLPPESEGAAPDPAEQ
ncbi:MAG TPA: cyclic peptide export ABC transporter [Longimicrobiaceae bacterium]|nr:cyclic peptide export ABC transporter [Longimicrobiaceae bacterium]